MLVNLKKIVVINGEPRYPGKKPVEVSDAIGSSLVARGDAVAVDDGADTEVGADAGAGEDGGGADAGDGGDGDPGGGGTGTYVPNLDWRLADLQAYAVKRNINITGLRSKADVLNAIAKAQDISKAQGEVGSGNQGDEGSVGKGEAGNGGEE